MERVLKMKVVNKKLEEIKEYENNPRKNDKSVNALIESIKEFGFQVPVILDRTDTIICGHTRYKAATRLNLKEIPCLYADNLNEEQIKAFRLVDNKTNELSEWDFEKLADELSEIADIDMSMFEFPELNLDELNISDEDFLQDTQIVKDKPKAKTVVCPKCGEELKL